MQIGYRKYGQSGYRATDWWPNVGSVIDDLAVIRSMYTTDNDHGAILQFHTGRHMFDGYLPTIGAWIHYGLGTLNQNLPEFVVLGEPPSMTVAEAWARMDRVIWGRSMQVCQLE